MILFTKGLLFLKPWEKFEIEVADALEQAGWNCVRCCYITNEKTTSQVDIIAVSNYGVLSVECKSHTLDVLMKSKYGDNLIGYKSNRKIFDEDVLKQAENHKSQVFLSAVKLEERLGRTIAPVYSLIVFNRIDKISRIRDDFSNSIFEKQELTTENIIERLCHFKVYDDNEVTQITEHFKQFSDTSEERLNQHINYLKQCKETQSGLWDENCPV